MLGLAAVFLIGFLARFRRRPAGEWIAALFPISLFALLCFSSVVNMRYFLPVAAGTTLLAALGVADLASWIERQTKSQRFHIATGAAAALTAGLAILLFPAFYQQSVTVFRDDPRFALRDWIAANLPPSAVIAEQHRVGLVDSEGNPVLSFAPNLQQKVILLNTFPGEIPTYQALIDQGVTHVILIRGRYLIFEDPYDTLDKDLTPIFLQHRAFYRQVLAHGKTVWSSAFPHDVHRIARTPDQAKIERRLEEKLEVFELERHATDTGDKPHPGLPSPLDQQPTLNQQI